MNPVNRCTHGNGGDHGHLTIEAPPLTCEPAYEVLLLMTTLWIFPNFPKYSGLFRTWTGKTGQGSVNLHASVSSDRDQTVSGTGVGLWGYRVRVGFLRGLTSGSASL